MTDLSENSPGSTETEDVSVSAADVSSRTSANASQHNLANVSVNRGLWGRTFRLSLKELKETLRDRRTIVTLVLMPILVYPLLAVAFQKFVLTSYTNRAEKDTWFIGLAPSELRNDFLGLVGIGDSLLDSESDAGEIPIGEEDDSQQVQWFLDKGDNAEELRQSVADNSIDLGVLFEKIVDESARRPRFRAQFFYREGSLRSLEALKSIEDRLRAFNTKALAGRLERRQASGQLPVVIETEMATLSTPKETVSLGALVPLVLILMTVTGAVYPAIDLTAGERERGTMEMLVSAPVPRIMLLVAKYAAVMTVAMLTAMVNLIAMTATIASTGLGKLLFGDGSLSFATVGMVFALTLLFTAFFSAVLLAVTSFARSFKEAQAYLIPLMLVSLAPGVLSLMPGLKTGSFLALTPLVNIVLLARDLFDGTVVPLFATMTVISTLGYAGLALALAGRIFGTDAILYGSEGTWTDMLRPEEERQTPQVRTGMFGLAILFPAFILLSNVPALLNNAPIANRLALSSLISVLLFVVLPLVLCRIRRIRIPTTFRLSAPRVLSIGGAILLGVSLWPFIYQVAVRTTVLDQFRFAELDKLLAGFAEIPLWIKLATIAVVPAMTEEFFFRGFLLSGLRSGVSKTKAIVFSAILFGLFHVIVRESLMLERLLPSTLMGIVLGWVCVRTGSVIPGMLLHVLHNGSLMVISHYQKELEQFDFAIEETKQLPAWLMATAVVLALLGLLLVWYSTRATVDSNSSDTAGVSQ